MAERAFITPVPDAALVPGRMVLPMRQWERIALKWRVLAEQRRAYFHELYRSGRWTRYYTEAELLAAMTDAVAMAERWAAIAPLPEERAAPAAETDEADDTGPEQALAA
jgi:uncharacterized repeat protein (TIGR03809 family)